MQPTRWEHRTWDAHAATAARRLARHGAPLGRASRTDTYLLSADDALLAKLRDGTRFEVKRRRGHAQGLDRWTMAARRNFPLPLGGAAPLLLEAEACATPEALLAEARRAGLRVVRVTKHRWRYRLGGAEAEIVRVTEPREALTVGIEAARLPDALAARARLGLTDAPNADYGAWLRRGGPRGP